MGLGDLKKVTAKRVLGLDCSTNSMAFCLYDEKVPVKWGEIMFDGDTVFKRAIDANNKIRAFRKQLCDIDLIVLEPSVYVNNRSTVINLAYVTGTIVSSLGIDDIEESNPVKWQRAIGNPPLTKEEKSVIQENNPNKSKTWYSAEYRRVRKQRTIDWVNNVFGVELASDNVADAFGIGFSHWKK